jgi:phospholipase/carboxylesterase
MRTPFDDDLDGAAVDVLTEWCDLDAGGVVEVASLTGPRRAFLPCHYEPGYQYPLIVWLRSSMKDDADIARWMPAISERNFVAIEVTGPLAARFALGRSSWPSDRTALAAVETAVEAGISTAFDYFSINPERVFLAGAGEAGTLALTAGLVSRERFAGAVAIDPGQICLMTLLREFRRLSGRRILIGGSDQHSNDRGMVELVDLLTTAGVDVTTCEARGKERPLNVIGRKVNEWMMQIVYGQRD